MKKIMRILALTMLFLVPKIGFAECSSCEKAFIPCEKTYCLPDQVAIVQEGIFVNLNDVWVQTDAIFADALGTFFVSKKNSFGGNCPDGQIECRNPRCKKCYYAATNNRCPYCLQ